MNPLVKSAVETAKTVASMRYRARLSGLRSMSPDSFWQYQNDAFKRIYQDAVANVPYYQSNPHKYPKHLESTSDVLDVLASLPVLPKDEVKKDTTQFWRRPQLFLTAEHTTGGTTGSPLKVRASFWERGFTEAILRERYKDITGSSTPRILRLSGYLDQSTSSEIIVRIPGTRYAYLSIYELKAQRKDEIRAAIDAFKPDVLHGYASALHQLALLFADEQYDPAHTLTAVSTSETLFDHQRADIEQYLGAQVFNEYGSQEGQHLVLECPERSLHIHPARGVVEILKMESDAPAESGELGRVVVTGLMSRSMPLIRYDLGDSAISTGYASNCSCGLRWPTIGTVYGRTDDLVRTRDGRMIGMLSYATLKDAQGVQESQIIQRGYEDFVYRIVPHDLASFDRLGLENHVRLQLKLRIGYEVDVSFEYIDRVPRSQLGKLQAVSVEFQ